MMFLQLSWGCCLRRNTQFQNNTKNTALWAIAFKTYKYCNHFWGWRGGNSTSYDCGDHDQAAVTAVNAANGCLLDCLLVEGHQHLFWCWNKMPTATYSNQASSSNSQFRKSRYLQREELVHQALRERCAKCLSRTPQAGLRLSQKKRRQPNYLQYRRAKKIIRASLNNANQIVAERNMKTAFNMIEIQAQPHIGSFEEAIQLTRLRRQTSNRVCKQ